MLRHIFLTPAGAALANETSKNTIVLRAGLRLSVLALAITFCYSSAIEAAPYLNLWLEARQQGSDADFGSVVNVGLGDTIEYRLRVDVAPIGTTNTNTQLAGRPWQQQITKLIPGRDGVNSLSLLTLFQPPDAGIQVHFNSAAVLTSESFPGVGDGWNSGTGARGGVPTLRPGSAWNDLNEIRPIHRAGVFTAIDPETVCTGTASVASANGPFSHLNGRAAITFGMRINDGPIIFSLPQSEGTADPLYTISPLTLITDYDVASNQVTVNYAGDSPSPAGTLREQLIAGRGGIGVGNGVWTGSGIASSAAAAANAIDPESRAVGYAENPAAPLGDLTAAGENDPAILIRYTRTGDANLDGVVNDDDLTIVSANYAPGVPNLHWAMGDFDYNGFVDDDDVTLLGAFYDPAAAPLAASAESSTSSRSQVTAFVVPEPSTAMLFLAMCCCAACTATARNSIRRIVAGFVLVIAGTTLHAAPFINFTLEGRKQGSNADFASSLEVAVGDTIEYRLRVDTAAIGTVNAQFGKVRTINELIPGRDGINSLSLLTLSQSPDDGIQTHFESPAVVVDGWKVGVGARGGVPTPRAGLPWNDLVDVRAIQDHGIFAAIDPETVFTGTFDIAEARGPLSIMDVDWGIGFGMKYNGAVQFIFPENPDLYDQADPYIARMPLTLMTRFDVGVNQTIVNYAEDIASPEATLREQLIAGRGGIGVGNGLWTGPGIFSSAAAAANAIIPESQAVGYADTAAVPLGDLTSAGENDPSILIRYTRTGDANFDGIVNDDDLTIVSANYAPGVPNPHWALGDFDYNGFVDDDDVTLLGVFYDPAAAPLPARFAGSSAIAANSSVAAIPEPATTVLATIAGCAAALCLVTQHHRRLRRSHCPASTMS